MKALILFCALVVCNVATASVPGPCAHVGDPVVHRHSVLCVEVYWHDRVPHVTPEGRSSGEAAEALKRMWYETRGEFGMCPVVAEG